MPIPVTIALTAALLAQQDQTEQNPPIPEWPITQGSAPQELTPPPLTHPDRRVDHLLDEIEKADAGLTDARAKITYTRHDLVLESVVTRLGILAYIAKNDQKPGVFAVTFDRLIDEDNRLDNWQKRWVFDGRWLVEQDFKSKSYVRREIAREGDETDPMRLGEGPLPLPIGQKKQAILERYEAEMPGVLEGLEAPANEWEEHIGGRFVSAVESRSVQLRLVPRVADPEGFDEIRLWYGRASGGDAGASGRLFPMLAKATKQDRQGNPTDVAWVFLSNVEANVGVDRAALLRVPAERDGWDVEVRPLPEDRGRAGRGAGGGSR